MRSSLPLLLLLVPCAWAQAGPDPVEARGSGWRVRGGVLESAVAGMRVAPPAGWRAFAGEEAEAQDPNADVALALGNGWLTVTMDAQEALGMEAGERKEEMLVTASLGKARLPGAKALEVRIAGVTFKLEPWSEKEGRELAWIGGVAAEGRGYLVTARCAAAGREQAEARIAEGVAAFEPMEERERVRLASELMALPDNQAAFLPTAALRRGKVRDFARGLTWQLPRGFWSVHLHDARKATEMYHRTLVATVSDRVLGVEGTLEFHPTVVKDLPSYQAEMVGWFLDQSEGGDGSGTAESKAPKSEVGRPEPVEFCGTQGLSTRVRDGEGWEWRVVSALRGRDGVTVWFNGEEAAMAAAAGTIDAALRGVEREVALRAESLVGDVHRDERYGWSMVLPPGAVADPPGGALPEGLGCASWKAGAGTAIRVIAGKPAPAFARMIEAIVADYGVGGNPSPVEEAVLDGAPCRRRALGRPGRVLYSCERDGIAYHVILGVPGTEPGPALEDLRARFRFVD